MDSMGDWDYLIGALQRRPKLAKVKGNVVTTALAIFCPDSDLDLLAHTMQLLGKRLPAGEAIFPICLPGGAAPLAYGEHYPLKIQYLALKEYLRDVCEVKPHIRRIFLVAHRGCGYYQKKIRNLSGVVCDTLQELHDLPKIAAVVNDLLNKEVLCFYTFFENNEFQYQQPSV